MGGDFVGVDLVPCRDRLADKPLPARHNTVPVYAIIEKLKSAARKGSKFQ